MVTFVGVSSAITVNISNPGAGVTSVTLSEQQIYLPNHGLETNDKLVYNPASGDTIKVSLAQSARTIVDGDTLISTDYVVGINTFTLSSQHVLYAAKISDDIIGIATNPVAKVDGTFVGIGSTSSGLLFFTNLGSGQKHNFTTQYANTISGLINRNVVTVSTASTHALVANESIKVDVLSGITTSLKLSYNEETRRVLGSKKSFTKTEVDLLDNIIEIPNHGFVTGQKVVYVSALSSADRVIIKDTIVDTTTIFPSPLEVERPYTLKATETGVIIVDADAIPNNSIFYVTVLDYNRIQLATSYYNAT